MESFTSKDLFLVQPLATSLKGQSVLRYLERVIQEVNDGNKDYDSLLPGVLAL